MKRYSKKGWEKRKNEREGYSEFYQKHCEIAKGRPCQNCGRRLAGVTSNIAHIFEKSTFKSVAKNDDNILYLCSFVEGGENCHARFDSTFKRMSEMPVFKIALERFEIIKELIENQRHKKYYFFEDQNKN